MVLVGVSPIWAGAMAGSRCRSREQGGVNSTEWGFEVAFCKWHPTDGTEEHGKRRPLGPPWRAQGGGLDCPRL
jgi:hypothetical protein